METLNQDANDHKGKTIAGIYSTSIGDGLVMAEEVAIIFTDGTRVNLGIDWRGDNAYISQIK